MEAKVSYTVVGLLGRGGMAVVELAVDEAGRQVARKRVALSGSSQQIDLARQRLRREAEVLASLHHPGIVPLLAVEDDGSDVVIVMPRMVGSLADRVALAGPLPPDQVTRVGYVLLHALATAHRQGVVHRDITPANVLFDESGQPALSDFGIASTRQFTQGLTMAGMVMGTPEFISPEQARGEPATPASDVFALGATLAFALTGRGPYGEGPPIALMTRSASGQVGPLPKTIPAELRQSLTTMLDPRPERRPSAAAALGGPTGTREYPVPPQRKRPRTKTRKTGRRGRRVVLTVVGLLIVVIGGGAGLAAMKTQGSPAPTTGTTAIPSTTPACVTLPFQACGQPPAPHTDGTSCLPGYADYDHDPVNGCEAASTYVPGTVLSTGQPVHANLVPADAVDSFRTYVSSSLLHFCLGQLHFTLKAPPGVTDRLEVIRDGKTLATAESRDGRPATASARQPSCFSDNSGWLTLKVSSVSGASAADFELSRSGSW
jgi:serine/threonine protein kinase